MGKRPPIPERERLLSTVQALQNCWEQVLPPSECQDDRLRPTFSDLLSKFQYWQQSYVPVETIREIVPHYGFRIALI